MRMRLALLAGFIALVGGACRDLELPTDLNVRNPGPTLTFLSPSALQDGGAPEVGIQAFVALSAEDADGVDSVDLACEAPDAGATLAHMTIAPYQSSVNFGPCRTPGSAPDAVLSLTLRALGTDLLGNTSDRSQTVDVRVNASVATLSLDLPQHVAPGKPFELTVHSDIPLLGPPVVDIEGIGAQLLSSIVDAGSPSYHYRTGAAQLLGADRWDGGLPVPSQVLEETERGVSVKVDAQASNGNASELTAQVLVSRVLWDTPLPAAVVTGGIDASVEPTPTPDGLQVPLASITWTPEFVDADTGQLTSLPPGFFTSMFPRALDLAGNTVIAPTAVAAAPIASRVIAPKSGVTLRDAAVLASTSKPLYPVGKYVCEEHFTQAGCPAVSPSVSCLSSTGEVTATLAGSVYNAFLAPWGVSSGNVLMLQTSGGLCPGGGAGVVVIDMGASPPTSIEYNAFPFTPLLRALPVGDGTFIGVVSNTNLAVNRFSVNNSVVLPTTIAPAFRSVLLSYLGPNILLARADATLIGFYPDPPYTHFFLYSPIPNTYTIQTRIDGAFDQTASSHGPVNALLDSKGALFVLMRRVGLASGERVVVLSLDSSLNPRWIYHYPRPDAANVYDFHLSMDEARGIIYLVDGFNGHALALSR